MKKALIALTAIAASASAFAQGTITFYNNNIINPTTGATYTAGIWQDNQPTVLNDSKNLADPANAALGFTGAGTLPGGVTVGLFLAGNNTPVAITTLRTGTRPEVFVGTQDATITGAAPGSPANLVIRAWSTSAGSFAAAQTINGAQWGEAAFTSKALGGINPNPPPPSFTAPDIAPFPGLEMEQTVPEPSTIALGVLGVGALVLARRRK